MTRIVLSLIFMLLLTACAARYQPAGPVCCVPHLETGLQSDGVAQPFDAVMQDGLSLRGHVWTAPSEQAVILALHGFGDYSLAFDEVATWWRTQKITVYAPDQRGFGHSGEYGVWAGADTYAGDARQLLDLIRQHHPGKPVYGLGMSMGGAVTIYAAADGAGYDGLLLVAPAVLDKRKLPLYQRLALWLAANMFPAAKPSGSNVNRQPTDNIDMLRKMGKDPLYYKRSRLDTVAGLIDLMDRAMTVSGTGYLPPVMVMTGAKDELVEQKMSDDFRGRLQSSGRVRGKITLKQYDDGWHMLLRDKQRQVVWQDIRDYIMQKRH